MLFSHPLPIKFYTGGMPRASYGDRYTLTAMREGKMVVFDFGSPVVDFFVVPSLRNQRGFLSNFLSSFIIFPFLN